MVSRFRPALLPSTVVLAVVAWLALPATPSSPAVAVWLLVWAAVGGLHRPHRANVTAAGATALALAVPLLGPRALIWLVPASRLGADAVAWLAGQSPRPSRRSLRTVAETSLAGTLAGLGAILPVPGVAPPLLALGGYLLGLLALGGVRGRLAGSARAVTLEGIAWGVGVLLTDVAAAGLEVHALALVAALELPLLFAARERLLRRQSQESWADLDRLHRAGARISSPPATPLALAIRVLEECRDILPVSYFHLELAGEPDEDRDWQAGPDEPPTAGTPTPPARPSPLPGIHRRVDWVVLDRPLAAGRQPVGHLRLWCDPRRLEPPQVELLDRLLPQLGASINARRLARQANQDPLTGLSTRRALDHALPLAFERASQDGGTLAVVLVDLDHFKRINDTWGHPVGDEALVAVAHLLGEQLRDGDLCARYGGEEFALLLEETEAEVALAIAERLRASVEAHELMVGGERVPLTLSGGVAAFPELWVREARELLELADIALYEAKRSGRNRCLIHLGRSFRSPSGQITRVKNTVPQAAPTIFA